MPSGDEGDVFIGSSAGGAAAGSGPSAAGASEGPGRAAPMLGVSYRGRGADLFLLLLKNAILTVLTLGIYGAWARTERRKYMWRHIVVGEHSLDYGGTGRELLLGYLKMMAAYVGLFVAPPLVVGTFSQAASQGLRIMGGLALVLLVPLAIYWSRRYLLSRTRWRDIRFGLGGDAGAFAKQFLLGLLLTLVTLGVYGPIFGNRIFGVLVRNTRYGNRAFTYDGEDREAFFIGLKGFLLTVVTLGIYVFWYRAAVTRFRMSHTHFDQATARFDGTGGLLAKVTLVAVFGNLFTLGIALPWTLGYALRQILPRLTLVGTIDFASIAPETTPGNAMGDALGSALGVELGV